MDYVFVLCILERLPVSFNVFVVLNHILVTLFIGKEQKVLTVDIQKYNILGLDSSKNRLPGYCAYKIQIFAIQYNYIYIPISMIKIASGPTK